MQKVEGRCWGAGRIGSVTGWRKGWGRWRVGGEGGRKDKQCSRHKGSSFTIER